MKARSYIYLLPLGFVFISYFFLGAINKKPADVKLSEIEKVVSQLLKAELMKGGKLSFTLLDSKGTVLYSKNPDLYLTPASNLKVLSTAAALEILGKDFRFKTNLEYSGEIINGVLNGDIIIRGFGDPTLGSSRFDEFPDYNTVLQLCFQKIRQLGIQKINGNIIADPGAFSINTIPDGWIWTDVGNYYGAGSGGLNFNENQYKLYFKPGSPGQTAKVLRTEPQVPYLKFINEMKTGNPGSGDNGYIFGGTFSDVKFLKGTIPAGKEEFSIKGSIPDPAYFLAFKIKEKLSNEGIECHGTPVNLLLNNIDQAISSKIIYTFYSPELATIAKETNNKSVNLFAEALLNFIGYKVKGYGSTENGLDVLEEWLSSQGIRLHPKCLVDGSGLSPGNSISSESIASLLKSQLNNSAFVKSLPIAGESGTIKYFCHRTSAKGKVMAKSGSFSKVLGYSGYLIGKNGNLYPFSILVNDYNGEYREIKSELEKIITICTEQLP